MTLPPGQRGHCIEHCAEIALHTRFMAVALLEADQADQADLACLFLELAGGPSFPGFTACPEDAQALLGQVREGYRPAWKRSKKTSPVPSGFRPARAVRDLETSPTWFRRVCDSYLDQDGYSSAAHRFLQLRQAIFSEPPGPVTKEQVAEFLRALEDRILDLARELELAQNEPDRSQKVIDLAGARQQRRKSEVASRGVDRLSVWMRGESATVPALPESAQADPPLDKKASKDAKGVQAWVRQAPGQADQPKEPRRWDLWFYDLGASDPPALLPPAKSRIAPAPARPGQTVEGAAAGFLAEELLKLLEGSTAGLPLALAIREQGSGQPFRLFRLSLDEVPLPWPEASHGAPELSARGAARSASRGAGTSRGSQRARPRGTRPGRN